eukprot:TRINITY_DN48315_c0_g1_i1.p1 TRINITY_DN48315_c0_g1~~TRINITY_DN48315_c0_g1_i1.p1  ORF type:complete len:781 (-),score=77.89 TRINITY_DN48315_c0_g1_i1:8-2350(-)
MVLPPWRRSPCLELDKLSRLFAGFVLLRSLAGFIAAHFVLLGFVTTDAAGEDGDGNVIKDIDKLLRPDWNCERPSAVEWRVPERQHRDVAAVNVLQNRAAVCFLGVARFVDATVDLLKANLLDRLGTSYDLFTFASQGRHERTCERYLEKGPSWSAAVSLSSFAKLWEIDAPAPQKEWDALMPLYDLAVAGRIVWDDRPLELLQSSGEWRKAASRPGAWLGGLTHGSRIRPGAGLAQLRALQWCADLIRWHETNVLFEEYTHLVFSRWDLHWLIPFPGLPLLTTIDNRAVWVPETMGDYFANDRFAALPREFLGAYFEGWQLLVTGEADRVIQAVLPRSGQPLYHGDHTNCEAFLFARLRYAGAHLAGLPPMAYVHCEPTTDWKTLRTRGYHSCTPISQMFGTLAGAQGESLGGLKYAREFHSVLMTDNTIEGIFHDTLSLQNSQIAEYELWMGRLQRLFGQRRAPVVWSEDLILRAAFVASQFEVNKAIEEGMCAQADLVRIDIHHCSMMLRRLLHLAQSRAEYYSDAAVVARAMVLAAPLHLEHWIMLTVILAHPYLEKQAAAVAALRQARRLNFTHPAVVGLQRVVSDSVDSGRQQDALAEALGGKTNATGILSEARSLTVRELRMRRVLQKGCVRLFDPRTRGGLDAWLAYGEYFLKEHWIVAAVGVLMHLESAYLRDARPEALRRFHGEVKRVHDFRDRLNNAVVNSEFWVIWGSSLDDYRLQAPSPGELISNEWLERNEALTARGGRDSQAAHVTRVAFGWSSTWSQMVPIGVW